VTVEFTLEADPPHTTKRRTERSRREWLPRPWNGRKKSKKEM
jgi:hypothetical protein